MLRSLILFVFLIMTLSSVSQVVVVGTVVSNEDERPVEAASIFFPNTMAGTTSDASGSFKLTYPGSTNSELVVSHISYKTQYRTVSVGKDTISLLVKLQPESFDLEEIAVVNKKAKKNKRHQSQFEKAILGNTPNAKLCEIVNPEILRYYKNDDGTVNVVAQGLLQIDNQALGYHLYIHIDEFQIDGLGASYSIKPYFKEMKALSKKESAQWEENRSTSYLGSFAHFIDCLQGDSLINGGFDLHLGVLSDGGSFKAILKPDVSSIFDSSHSNYDVLNMIYSYRIVYLNEKVSHSRSYNVVSSRKILSHPAERDMVNQEQKTLKDNIQTGQTSYLFGRSKKIKLSKSGLLLDPELLVEYGYWVDERLADLLPLKI